MRCDSGSWGGCQRLLGRLASESGRLGHGDGGHAWGARRRRALMLPILRSGRTSAWRTTHFFPPLLKLAITEAAVLSVTVHVSVPLQPPPLQPLNRAPRPGTAVKVTTEPAA